MFVTNELICVISDRLFQSRRGPVSAVLYVGFVFAAAFAIRNLAMPQWALVVLSLYWLGMMLSRLALGTVLRRVSSVKAMYTCITFGVAGAVILLMTRNPHIAAMAVFMLGIGFVRFNPDGLLSSFTALPIQIFQWTTESREEFVPLAASASVVLLVILLAMMASKGTSVLRSVYVINRGYEDLAARLNLLGASIETFRDI